MCNNPLETFFFFPLLLLLLFYLPFVKTRDTVYDFIQTNRAEKASIYISRSSNLIRFFPRFFFFFARKIRFWKDSTRCQFSLEKKSKESLSKNILHLDDIDWIFRKGRKLTRECWIKYVFTIKNVYGDFFLKRSKVIRLYK